MSGDGRWVAFRASGIPGTETARLAVVGARGGQRSDWIVLTDDALNVDKPRWSKNSDAIYFTSDNGGVINLWRIGFDSGTGRASGPPERLTAFTGPGAQLLPDIRALEVGFGGERVVVPVVHQKGALWLTERASSSKQAASQLASQATIRCQVWLGPMTTACTFPSSTRPRPP
jgi:hypothetical protein